jgi:hypothetical protein
VDVEGVATRRIDIGLGVQPGAFASGRDRPLFEEPMFLIRAKPPTGN